MCITLDWTLSGFIQRRIGMMTGIWKSRELTKKTKINIIIGDDDATDFPVRIGLLDNAKTR